MQMLLHMYKLIQIRNLAYTSKQTNIAADDIRVSDFDKTSRQPLKMTKQNLNSVQKERE